MGKGGARIHYTIPPASLGIKCLHRKAKKQKFGVCKGLCPRCYGKYVATVNPELVKARNARQNATYAREQARRREAIRVAYQKKPEWKKRDERCRKYGINVYQFNQIARDQEYACAICGEVPKRLNVDHCHKSGRVRGLLCWRCNRGLEHYRDDPQIMRVAAVYLESEFDGRAIVPERSVLGHLARKAERAGGMVKVRGQATDLVVFTEAAFREMNGALPTDTEGGER